MDTLKKNKDSIFEEVDRLSDKLEKVMECKVLLLIFHDLAPINRDVVDDLEFYMQMHINEYRNNDVCVILHTSGGDADAAYHIGKRLQGIVSKDHKLIFIIPRFAKSAGILLACSGDEIHVTPITELGPVDPQIY